jgi:hypothetical protein
VTFEKIQEVALLRFQGLDLQLGIVVALLPSDINGLWNFLIFFGNDGEAKNAGVFAISLFVSKASLLPCPILKLFLPYW